MPGISKNLGAASALFIGTSAPSNTSLVWYDSTPSVKKHKVYDFNLSSWVVLNPNSFTSISYATLRALATGTGLVQLSWYKITDKANCLALAITQTKVQYVDSNNNFIIDDLAGSAVYVVNSGNLYIDDKGGVWDSVNNRLKFDFTPVDVQTAISGEDYLFGKSNTGGVVTFVKHKIKSLISAVTGNSISWNNGLYFNFLASLQSLYDEPEGVASKSYVDTQLGLVDASLTDLSNAITDSYNNALTAISNAVTATNIYNKLLPSAPTAGTPVDIAKNDTLLLIINKIQRWINSFKVATGIKVTSNFASFPTYTFIAPNDPVDIALRKLQRICSDFDRNFYDVNGVFLTLDKINSELQNTLIPRGLIHIKLKTYISGIEPAFPFCVGLCVNNGNSGAIVLKESGATQYKRYTFDDRVTNAQILAFQTPVPMFINNDNINYDNSYDIYAAIKHKYGKMTIQIMMETPLHDSQGSSAGYTSFSYQVDLGRVFGCNFDDIELNESGAGNNITISQSNLINLECNVPNNETFQGNFFVDFEISLEFNS